MKRSLVSLVFAMAILVSVQAPANAASEMLTKIVKVPVVVTAFGLGAVIGTPIAVMRKSFTNARETTNNLVGDDANPLLKGAGALVGVPVGMVKGTFQGVILGTKNAYSGSGSDEPFGTDTFSLGDLD